MKEFISEVETIKVSKCKTINPEELIKCDSYQYRKYNHPSVCIWKSINGNCIHPHNFKD